MTQRDREITSIDNPSGGAGDPTPTGLAAAQPDHTSSTLPQHGSAQSFHDSNHESDAPSARIGIRETTIEQAGTDSANALEAPAGNGGKATFRGSWTIVTMAGALLLTLLSIAGIVLVTRPRATIDQLLILTVPSGADVTFDGRNLGPSPVKLEGLRIGTHRIQVTKDGYQEAEYTESITSSTTLDYKLKLMTPPGAEGLTVEEQISQYKLNMARARSTSPS